ncbi:hypothetical protein U1Q18_040787, partial [Sarracenia purpurea var. burkii]
MVEEGKSGVVEPVGGIADLGFPSSPLPISGDGSGLDMDRDQGYDNMGKGSISEEGTKSDAKESVSEEDDQGVVDDPGAGDYDDEVDESEASLTKGEGAAREGADLSRAELDSASGIDGKSQNKKISFEGSTEAVKPNLQYDQGGGNDVSHEDKAQLEHSWARIVKGGYHGLTAKSQQATKLDFIAPMNPDFPEVVEIE